MSEYQKIADKINNTEDYANCLDDMRALCHAAGMDEELAKRPDDSDWVWEVAWQAAQKLDVDIDEPFFHFYETFRVEAKMHCKENVNGKERDCSYPYLETQEWFEAKAAAKKCARIFGDGIRIVGVCKNSDYKYFVQTKPEEILMADEAAKDWTYLDTYIENLMAEKLHLTYALQCVENMLKDEDEKETLQELMDRDEE